MMESHALGQAPVATRRGWILTCLGWACAGALGMGGMECDAEQLVGLQVRDGLYQLRSLDTADPGRVRDLGLVPASSRGRFQGLASGGADGIGLVHDAKGRDGESLALVVQVTDPQAASLGDEIELPLPDADAVVRQVVAPEPETRLVISSSPGDRPPFTLATYHRGPTGWRLTGQVSVPEVTRVANLTQCPDGTNYVSLISGEGGPQLAELDWVSGTVVRRVSLQLGGQALTRDVVSLACGAGGRVYALADAQRNGPRRVYRVDTQTGALGSIGIFNVDSIALWPDNPAMGDSRASR